MAEVVKEIRLKNKLTTAEVDNDEYIKRMVKRLETEGAEPSEADKRELRRKWLKKKLEEFDEQY